MGEFSLSGLTSNFAAQTLEIAIRMDIDANGILHVDAEEARSGAKALFIIGSDQQSSTITQIFHTIVKCLLYLSRIEQR